jgi:hypothetical protein
MVCQTFLPRRREAHAPVVTHEWVPSKVGGVVDTGRGAWTISGTVDMYEASPAL